MKKSRTLACSLAVPLAMGLAAGSARADGDMPAALPEDARPIVDEYQKAANAIRARAEAEMAALREKAIPKLKALQDKHCRAARLDEALAIRQVIRAWSGVLPDPGTVRARPEDIGKSFLYQVTGSLEGSIWGTEVYTTDSSLAAAAVHAGVLKPGETGVVKVRILPGQKSYLATTAHGVTSAAWGQWSTSFTVERSKVVAERQ